MRSRSKVLLAAVLLFAIVSSDTIPSSLPTTDFANGREIGILFVPLDARPITYSYPLEVARRHKVRLVVPPKRLLEAANQSIDGLYQWLADHISQADGAVLSVDTLIYGGLVPSRWHNLSLSELQDRLGRLRHILRTNPGIKVYAYASIMRLPREGGGREEPFYYEQFGAKIYQLSVLTHKRQLGLLTKAETRRIQELSSAIPVAYLEDYLARRRKNLEATKELLKANPFDYLVLSRDDTSEYGLPRMEYLELSPLLGAKSTSITGADEIGLLLLARMVNALEYRAPKVFVDYASPQATHFVPLYEDEPLNQVVTEHIAVAGGQVISSPEGADLVLMVNNLPGPSLEASSRENWADRPEKYLSGFIKRAKEYIKRGKPVAIADVAFANGADNKLVKLLLENGLYSQLESYAGWNSASNTLGSAIAELMLRGTKEKCLITRLVEDWAYQANVRQEVKRMVVEQGWDPYDLKGKERQFVEQIIRKKLNEFLGAHGIRDITVTGISLPWNRTFEIDFSLERPGRKQQEEYDVIVVGAEPEGVAAAVAAARSGARVLVLEKRNGPGGLYTYGWLNSFDMNYGPKNELLTRGVFAELFREAGGTSFDVEHVRRVFDKLLSREANLAALYDVSSVTPVLNSRGAVVAVTGELPCGKKKFQAKVVIDATQDADLAAMAGVPHTFGGEDYGVSETMPATLIFKLKGVDWLAVQTALWRDGNPFTGADADSAWGFETEMRRYRPSNPRLKIPGLNIGRQKDGTVLINALQIFGVNGLDPISYRQGYNLAQRELHSILTFIRANVSGFSKAELAGVAPELYIRETRHIRGEYTLTIDDVLGNRYFPDQIGVASYPVDLKATTALGKPIMYSIPFRSLVPLGVDNLLVVGRSASYSSLAAGSARVVPVGMVTGQAAGVAAAMAAKKKVTPREIARNFALVREVQSALRSQGAYLPPFSFEHPVVNHWAYSAVRELQRLGLAYGGYDNNYHLDEPMTSEVFVRVALTAFQRTYPTTKPPPEDSLPSVSEKKVTLAEARHILNLLIQWYQPSHTKALIPARARHGIHSDAPLLRAQGYMLIVEALKIAKSAETSAFQD